MAVVKFQNVPLYKVTSESIRPHWSSVQLTLGFSQSICKYTGLVNIFIQISVEEKCLFMKHWEFAYKHQIAYSQLASSVGQIHSSQ